MKQNCILLFGLLLTACGGEKMPDNKDIGTISIIPSKSVITFAEGSASEIVTIQSNVEWDFECEDLWVSLNKIESTKLSISVGENFSSSRNTIVHLKKLGQSSSLATISISQSGKTANPQDKVFTVEGNGKKVSFTMKFVEHGTFMMGSDDSEADQDERPVHRVTLTNDYYIGETEVTQALWFVVMGERPLEFHENWPTVQSFQDCMDYFLPKLNIMTGQHFRLPSEAEWEYAARGGLKSKGFIYAGSNTIDEVAWFKDNTDSRKDVKGKKPNELGIYDMSGNEFEMCQDWYDQSYYSNSPEENPTGPSESKYRVERGGRYRSTMTSCRVSVRSYLSQTSHLATLRLVLQ